MADDCKAKAITKGYCDKHYRRLLNGQSINALSKFEKSEEQRFWEKVDRLSDDECWNWIGSILVGKNGGYGTFNAEGFSRAHRYSYKLHYGYLPSHACVLHKCDNRSCVNPHHLFLGDRADNAADKVGKGRQCRGETRPLSKLTENAVRKIRSSNKGTSELARELNVSPSAVSMVRTGKTWRHVVP
jgi:hypothetical protein